MVALSDLNISDEIWPLQALNLVNEALADLVGAGLIEVSQT